MEWPTCCTALLLAAVMLCQSDVSGKSEEGQRFHLLACCTQLGIFSVTQPAAELAAHSVCRYAVLRVDPGSMLLIAVAKEALRQLPEFGPQELTITVWSYARLHQPGQVELPEVVRLLDAAAGEMQRQLQDPRLQHKVRPAACLTTRSTPGIPAWLSTLNSLQRHLHMLLLLCIDWRWPSLITLPSREAAGFLVFVCFMFSSL